ncbi:MAG: hypothetical protein WAS05_03475 [Candidatus Nanopelagicales bacterium]
MNRIKELSPFTLRRSIALLGAGVLLVGATACSASSSSESPSPNQTSATASDLPTEPEVPAGKVAVAFDVENCANCTVTASPTGAKQFDIPLNDGKGSTLLDKGQITKTFFTITGPQYKDAMAVSALITQLPGKSAGTSVSNDDVKNAKKGNICLAAVDGQRLNIAAKVVPVASGSGTMARFWADPTLAGAQGKYGQLDLYDGVAGVQNDGLC